MNPPNRRRHERHSAHEVQVRVRFAFSEEVFKVPCGDISVGGIFVPAAEQAAVGEPVTLELLLPGEPEQIVAVAGHVVRLAPGAVVGLAIEFAWADDAARSLLARYLADVHKATIEPPA